MPHTQGPVGANPCAGDAQRARSGTHLDGWLALATLVLPFFFFDWALPFVGHTTLGNDYQLFSIRQQLEIQFALAKGSFPLFIPGFAGGQSVQALTLGQAYHPIALLAAHMPGYWSGHAEACNTLLRLFSLGFAHLALTIFLRRLGLGRVAAFLLALVTTYNLRMLDLFRYGAALESWTGHLFLCASIGMYLLDRRSLGARAGIVASAYWLLTSGHPQMAYYGVLASLVFTLLVPFVSMAIVPTRAAGMADVLRFWARSAGLVGLGAGLSATYVVPFATEFLSSNARSVAGRDFAWALGWQDTVWGTLNNLVLPLRADVHGAFGGSSLPLLAFLVPVLFLFRRRVPVAIGVAWLLALGVVLAMQGERTPLYGLVWRYLPLVSSVRSPGRLAMALPMLVLCVLAWVLAPSTPGDGADREARRAALLGPVALLAALAYALVYFHAAPPLSDYSPLGFNHVPRWAEAVACGLGVVALAAWAAQGWLAGWRRPLLVLLCLCAGLQTKIALEHGTWKDSVMPTPTFAELEQLKAKDLGYRFASGEGMLTAAYWRQASEFHVEPRLARIYGRWRGAHDVEDAFRILAHGISPDEVVIEDANGPAVGGDETPTHAQVKLRHGTFNRLVFDVELARAGLLSIAYPHTGRWGAALDGVSVEVHRANGGHLGVFVPAGRHQVELRYRSVGQTVGWVVSALLLVLAVGVLVWPYGPRRALGGAVLAAAAAGGLLALQMGSLYTGQSLDSSYAWSEAVSPAGPPDLAYGRRTTMSSTFQIKHNCCPFVGSKGTDGDVSPHSGFMTEEEDAPVWGVDLGEAKTVGSVVAHESRRGADLNRRPLLAATSRDGRSWQPMPASFTEDGNSLRLTLPSPIIARYVAIRAGGRCRLALDEVEVFPPDVLVHRREVTP